MPDRYDKYFGGPDDEERRTRLEILLHVSTKSSEYIDMLDSATVADPDTLSSVVFARLYSEAESLRESQRTVNEILDVISRRTYELLAPEAFEELNKEAEARARHDAYNRSKETKPGKKLNRLLTHLIDEVSESVWEDPLALQESLAEEGINQAVLVKEGWAFLQKLESKPPLLLCRLSSVWTLLKKVSKSKK